MLDSIFQPFVDGSPTTVMASAALSRMLGAARLDALFEESRQGQYVNTLMFSTLVDLMAAVVIGSRGSIHAAYQAAGEEMKVSAPSVYEKMRNVETCTSQALVRESAAEMASLVDQMNGALPSPAPGYAVRILDGNCIAASEHRIKELRPLAAGALPGKSLAVLDPQRRLIRDVFPCEDGHANERSLLAQVLSTTLKGVAV